MKVWDTGFCVIFMLMSLISMLFKAYPWTIYAVMCFIYVCVDAIIEAIKEKK